MKGRKNKVLYSNIKKNIYIYLKIARNDRKDSKESWSYDLIVCWNHKTNGLRNLQHPQSKMQQIKIRRKKHENEKKQVVVVVVEERKKENFYTRRVLKAVKERNK